VGGYMYVYRCCGREIWIWMEGWRDGGMDVCKERGYIHTNMFVHMEFPNAVSIPLERIHKYGGRLDYSMCVCRLATLAPPSLS
jgi:hypothetical protein